MPKKKSSGKLVQMSEEERLLYMQQKLLAEEEQSKKKEDMLLQFLKDKLAKEEKNSAINMNKLNTQWRNILRDSKAKELHKDIEILSQTFERVVDCKDSVIKSLAKDLYEAEDQYSHALQNHLQNIDDLIHLQRERLKALEDEYNKEVEAIQSEFDKEREMLIEQKKEEDQYLQDVLLAMEQNFTEGDQHAKQEFQNNKDDVKNKCLEEKHALRVLLEGKVENLWKQFQLALKNYTDATEDRKIAFEILKMRDDKSANEIDTQMRKLQHIQESIAMTKNKIISHARDSGEKNRRLRHEKEVVQNQFQKLKGHMNNTRNTERSQLSRLTLESSATMKKLKSVIEKGERILRLSETCRKLETEEEKVLPFYASSLTAEEEQEAQKAATEKRSDPLVQVMHDFEALEKFWRRYNKVQLEHWALEREKAVMCQENQKLRLMLKQYLDGISVSDEVLSNRNSLLILNNQSNIQLPVPVTDNRVQRPVHNVIEAALVVSRVL